MNAILFFSQAVNVSIPMTYLQVRQVAFLPMVHEDKVQFVQIEVRPQPRDHLIRGVHDEFHLEKPTGI